RARRRSFPRWFTPFPGDAFDVGTHGGQAPIGRAPRAQDGADAGQHALEIGGLLFEQRADVPARGGPRAPERDDMTDLRERQAEPTGLPHEGQQAQHIRGIAPVAGWLAPWSLEDAARFVEAERLSADSAPGGDFTNQQAIPRHGVSVNPVPWGKVK